MNLPAQLFSVDWLWLCNLLFAFFLYRAVQRAPWRRLLDNSTMVNALIALLLCTFILWQLNAGIRPGFNFHILGSTLFVLMFGWQIASVMLALVMSLTWLRMDLDLVTLGLNGFTMILVPVLFSEWLLRLSQRHLPKNLFLFVLLNGFACAGIGVVLTIFTTTLVLLGLSHYTMGEILYHFFIPAPILTFAEAFATGMVITAFTVAQPEAVMNFSVDDYLTGK